MRRMNRLLGPLAAATARGGPVPVQPPTASGFLTIGGTTYIDPDSGNYPLDHPADGSAVLIINDTDHPVTIITERNRHAPSAAPAHAPPAQLVIAPGQRMETRWGDCVQIG